MDEDVAGWLAAHPAARPALHDGETWLTYGDLATWAARLASLLAGDPALPAGGRIAYLGANSPLLIALLFACARTGHVLVPLNWRLAAPELATILADCTPTLLCVEHSCAALGAALTPTGIRQQRAADWTPDALPAHPAPARAHLPDAPLLLCYTSGTTGDPKGAVLTGRTLAANARNATHMHDLTAADRVLTVLPLFHVGGLNIQTLPALRCGAEVVLLPRFEPAATLAAIDALRPTLTVQVPATLQALQTAPAWRATDLGSLRAVTTGSTDVPRDLIDTWHARGVPVVQVYGATETGPVAIYQQIPEAFATAGSIGRCGRETEVRLVRADGGECGIDEPGEIWLRGSHVISHYWRHAHADAFNAGWFRTGDVAQVDAAGCYWFKDRVKNVIISGGENIYPAELERVLRGIEGLQEAAVIGRPDPRWGAVPIAVVVAHAGVPQDALRDRVRAAFQAQLARYKHPRAVEFVDALPRTALGKVDVGALRARFG